ncbi:WD-40 repeat-containing protein [Lentzea albidocapillata subsp. violacea]|uniref:WD-40 repeat-containing protein n=1 Tax=Lentzea albidocapillata subsp. violacea TaxID=128104 RepID=A0A1G9EDF8_9PSEU|nr:hypothetical protein [Lentzea albidocapillata]SDK74210.1 WD-40 repeat-containing protein [Lentzea albidocapillata subsp. violacea]
MPRGETPLGAVDSELGRFAGGLRRLREKAGTPPYRELSSRAHYSAAALSEAAAGKKLPSLAVTLAYVVACGGDATEWEQRWRAIAEPPADGGTPPYAGLAAFGTEDADLFFGREKLTAKLVALTAERPFVGVFGASGSGKSSLLRAGLVPALDRTLVCTPGPSPLDECAVRLAELTGEPALDLYERLKADPDVLRLLTKGVTVVVDQFEEVFTLADEGWRGAFITALTRCDSVVIGVRADFYGHCGHHPALAEALEGAQLLVGPMTPDELRRAIVEPAQRTHVTVESALVTRLVADVAGQAAALPLMSHALVETWRRRRGMTMTLAGYEEAGGIEHSVARTAEQAFRALSAQQQQVARDVFLRLVVVGEGTDDTKRRVPRQDLDDEVLDRLAAARLIVLDRDHVDLAHETLLRSWPRLRDWIAEDRDAVRARQHLSEAVAAWEANGRHADAVYRGVRLVQIRELDGLTGPERDFLAAGTRIERRRAHRLRALAAVLTVLVVVLTGAVLLAVDATQVVAAQRNASLAREAASEARRLAITDPGGAARIALAAHAVARTDETRDAVLSVSAAVQRTSVPIVTTPMTVRFSPSGRALIVQDQDRSMWWVEGTERRPLPFTTDNRFHVSADEKRFFVPEDGFRVRVYEAGRTVEMLPHFAIHDVDGTGSMVTGVDVFETGDRISSPDRIRLWDLSGTPKDTLLPVEGVIASALSRDGRTLAVALNDGAMELWRVGGERIARWHREGKPATRLWMNDDGTVLAAWLDSRRTVQLWRLDGTPRWSADLSVSSSTLPDVAFGDQTMAVHLEPSIQVWDLRHEQPRRTAEFGGFTSHVPSMRYRPDIGEFVAFEWEGSNVWTLRGDLTAALIQVCAVAVSPLSDEEWRRRFPDVERVPVC